MVILTTVRRTPCGSHSITLMSLMRGMGMARVARSVCASAKVKREVAVSMPAPATEERNLRRGMGMAFFLCALNGDGADWQRNSTLQIHVSVPTEDLDLRMEAGAICGMAAGAMPRRLIIPSASGAGRDSEPFQWGDR